MLPSGKSTGNRRRPPGARTSYRRRALADWITDPTGGAGHLLGRVIVNRLWQHHFGRGIVATPSDFGAAGEPPTHPELLDYLAGELIAGGWRLKAIHKLIMTSAVYMQSTDERSAARASIPTTAALAAIAPAAGGRGRSATPCWRSAAAGRADVRARARWTRHMRGAASTSRSSAASWCPMHDALRRPRLAAASVTAVDHDHRPAGPGVDEQPAGARLRPRARQAVARRRERRADDAVRSPAYVIGAGPRPPTSDELTLLAGFCDRQAAESYQAAGKSRRPWKLALADFCQVLLGLNEFVYVE